MALLAQAAAARGDVDGVNVLGERAQKLRKSHEPHQGTREMARRRRQRERAGLRVAEAASTAAALAWEDK
jgi:hypothetical protein